MTEEEIHIGNIIKAKLKQQGRTKVWLAKQLPCSPNHVYKLLRRKSINTDMLFHISKVMDFNFFNCYKP
jgi:plasmid maintenance system antidote protein VapI